jgi:hypothetical protein
VNGGSGRGAKSPRYYIAVSYLAVENKGRAMQMARPGLLTVTKFNAFGDRPRILLFDGSAGTAGSDEQLLSVRVGDTASVRPVCTVLCLESVNQNFRSDFQ